MNYITIRHDIAIDDIFEVLSDKVLLKEVKSRDLTREVISETRARDSIRINPYEFRRQMCDMLDCSYCVSDADLVKALLDKIH